MLERYSLEYAPSPKDKSRYKLSLSCSESDVKELVKRLSSISSRPFSSTDDNYDWSFFLYDLSDAMKERIKTELNKAISSRSKVEGSIEEPQADAAAEISQTAPAAVPRLKQEYTFDNFVVGASTRFTYAACKSVAESPGKNYNPLFIYGGVGLGKTHLMHSIGNRVKEKYPTYKIVYITTGEFIREVVDAIESGKISDTRGKYKEVDLLLIDDIQFLEKSESTQEEFFNIFNEMYENGKQIVITSDKPPKRLKTLEDRLKSRFEWGLASDIKSPNFETRKAIMKRKCQKVRIELPEEISDYIAEKLTSNIRELEGIINRIYAYQQLSNDDITMDFIKEILKNFLPEDGSGDGETDKKEAGADPAPQSSAAQAAAPPQVPQYMPQQQVANLCPNCSGQLSFVHQYQRWYCMNCRMYTEPHAQYQPQPQQFQPPPRMQPVHPPPPPGQMQGKACAACSNQMRYISQYKRYYCDTCKQYEQQGGPPQQQPAPQGGPAPVPAPQAAQPAESAPAPQAAQPADNKDEKKTKKKEKDKETSVENKETQTYDERVIGQEKKGIREIKAGYFLCEADDELFENIVAKLDDLTSRKRFNFFIRPLFKHYYYTGGDVNYDKMAHISKTTDIDIALCLKPSKESKIRSDEFKKKLETVMASVEVPIEIISESEMKDSNALNFMLDIAICAKKRNSGG